MRALYRLLVVSMVLSSVGCATEVILHNLDEREANQVIELLAENDIVTTKGVLDNGRITVYSISVPGKSRIDAIKLINRYEMPRRRDMGYVEFFKDGGLIPTAGEERSKMLAALEGEIEKQLKVVDGVVDVQVQLVIPEESALRTAQDIRSPTTASVTLKYMPGPGGGKPMSEGQVQAIVAGGVERLTPDNVIVVMTPGGLPIVKPDKIDDKNRNVMVARISSRNQQMLLVVGVVAVVIFSGFLMFQRFQLRIVRNRLTRLQDEIAKAQRKSDV